MRCCHKPTSKRSTLVKSDLVFMSFPPQEVWVCKNCGKNITVKLPFPKGGSKPLEAE